MTYLTKREAEVVKLLCEGYLIKEISYKLNISEKTVEAHKTAIYKKTKSTRLIELYKYFNVDPKVTIVPNNLLQEISGLADRIDRLELKVIKLCQQLVEHKES